MTDEPTPEQLEQLARSVAMSGVLGDHDRQEVIDALRRLAMIDAATSRHPSGGRRPSWRDLGHMLNGHENANRPPQDNRGGRSRVSGREWTGRY